MRIYVCGSMSAHSATDYNYPAFHEAADRLRKMGYEVENPAETNGGDTGHPEGRPFYLRHAIEKLIRCDALAALPGWEQSAGARLEVAIACELGMRVFAYSGFQLTAMDPVVDVLTDEDEFDAELLNIAKLHKAKRADYTAGGPLLANYQFSSSCVGLSTERGMFMRMAEKFWRLKSLYENQVKGEGPAVKDESMDDTDRDIAIIALLRILCRRGGAYADR